MKRNQFQFALRFSPSDIRAWADRYSYPRTEEQLRAKADEVRRRGCLSKQLLREIALWKAPRSARHIEKNTEDFVEAISRFSLGSQDERCRIESLTLLDGVLWPTASVILHLFHQEDYPILDYRALWSLCVDSPPRHTFDFWWAYTQFSRRLATENDVDMRTLDQALWQYSKVHQ